MPFYTCFSVARSLSSAHKTFSAEEITRIHTTLTHAPRSFVRVYFQDMRPCDIFSGGRAQPFAMIRGVVRSGRTAATKAKLLSELWAMLQQVTGLESYQLLVSIQDNPASNAMEGGELLPEPEHEVEWLTRHSRVEESAQLVSSK
jgi:phenylpyruvate tautomerase PptA (4-oxalocrotonate tautomerase family)